MPTPISVSVVSHGQAALVAQLLGDFSSLRISGIELILTLNIEESLPFDPGALPFPVKVIRNAVPRGFAANHNAALAEASASLFCVVNPDIRLRSNPFPALAEELGKPGIAVAAPLIVDPRGVIEDSARPFPTLLSLCRKALGLEPRQYYEIGEQSFSPDWVGGMFMLIRRDAFAAVGGFDARYRLYYEDVDLCARLRRAGYDVRLVPGVSAIHDARRRSRWDPRYAFWHLRSMARYLVSDLRRG